MKKPKIELSDKWSNNIEVGNMYPYEIKEAYEEMIDALIDICRDLNDPDNILGEVSNTTHINVINALKSAGCTDIE